MKPAQVCKIALIGPESSGKSTLGVYLATHYQAICIAEYAREYLEKKGLPYTFEDVVFCIREQFRRELDAKSKSPALFFCDTDAIMAAVWFKDVFGHVPNWVEVHQQNHPADFYLLLKPDIPWTEDPLRENPHRREFIFDWYKRELEFRKLPYCIIEGQEKNRRVSAIRSIDEFLLIFTEKHNES